MRTENFMRSVIHVLFKLILLGFVLLLMSVNSRAATDLATAPVNFLVSAAVKPNLYFILDDSGSMAWSHVGDEVTKRGYEKAIGYRSHLCNKIYYNPAVTYPLPIKSDGSFYPAQSFTNAAYDGFQAGSIKIDLSQSFMPWRSYDSSPSVPANTTTATYTSDCRLLDQECSSKESGDYPNTPEPAYYFVFKGANSSRIGDGSVVDPCLDRPPSANWQKITVSSSSGLRNSDERTNFANWFSYHRTRMLTIKTALGRAFRDLDEQFRVGFSTIGENGVSEFSAEFLKIATFDANQKNKFYTKVYGIIPASGTPLRAALSKAGRLYAGKLLTGTDDPVQYSCQQNFTILSSDGYWNTSAEYGNFGPMQINGTSNVGDADYGLPAPMTDGSFASAPVYAAKITLFKEDRPRSGKMTISSIKVGGVELMSKTAEVDSPPDREIGVSRLAERVETFLSLAGYRAIALGPDIYVIAPRLFTAATRPVVTLSGAVSAAIGTFGPIDSSLRRSNTLADIAAYYFQTDLRQTALSNCGINNVCPDNVPVRDGLPGGSHQHMVTHTVGLGASGVLEYQEDYAEAGHGDFRDIVDGKRGWPDPILFNGPERIDDLWHAAVNGGGRYFNASSPEQIARALAKTLANIRSTVGAAAAAATSNQEPVEGDSLLFGTRYRSIYWDGELEARRINLGDGSTSVSSEWSAATKLDNKVSASADTRTIWLQSDSNASTLKRFVWSELSATEQNYLGRLCDDPQKLSQCANLTSAEKTAVTGERLLNYLRGQSAFEDRLENSSRFFRQREHVLGAPVNAQPVYVGRPAFRYADDNYGEFRDSLMANRKGIVYMAANDGMLHAFDAASGDEQWAFIPAGVLPGMYRYADARFSQNFSFLLDGSPVVGDVCPLALGYSAPRCTAEAWRTILVGGLGAAGREFYAIDITDPANPKALWRFGIAQDSDVGYALGKPLITKRRDGRWIVVLASGYNNTNPGTGRGYLFVLDAYTGERLTKIDTGAGSLTDPSGLAQINGWIENPLDNTSLRFYGGDLSGNVWRFDIDDVYPPAGREAVLLARLVRNGLAQPITTRPELSEIRIGTQRGTVVAIGTGRYLGFSDASDRSIQSVYSFRDDLREQGLGDVRSKLVEQTLSWVSGSTGSRSVSRNAVDWSLSSARPGWFFDLMVSGVATGERVTLDPDQQQGILRVVTNTPDGITCRPGAESWIYEIDYLTGTSIPSVENRVVARRIGSSALTAGARTLKLGEKIVTQVTDEHGQLTTLSGLSPSSSNQAVRRVSWRELDE